jgi:predicted molibdopterin-dependent oxidoreductase YjgC
MAEMAQITPQYGGVSHERIEREGFLQWPCPDADHPGTPILHTEKFTRGLGEFAAVDYQAPSELADTERPFILTTGRNLWNFHTNTMTGHAEGLSTLSDHCYVEINPADAKRLCVCDGDSVEVVSKHGSVVAEARVTHRSGPKPGVVFMPFHFAAAPANRLTGIDLDPTAKIPAFKVTAVRLAKVAEKA